MGDRAVFGFKADNDSETIYLYSHWGGANRANDLSDAIDAARPRWSDGAYATRIALSRLVGDQWSQELGFGISVGSFCEPDYSTMHVVNWAAKTVTLSPTRGNLNEPLQVWTFDAFTSVRHDDDVYA